MDWLVLSPLVWLGHGVLTLYDELWLHRRRRLGSWEARAHLAATALIVVLELGVFFLAPSPGRMFAYFVLAVASSLSITLEEKLHARVCPPIEHWVHALLFMLHPLALLTIGVCWQRLGKPLRELDGWPLGVLAVYTFGTLAFSIYQALYWRGPRLAAVEGDG
jgi:hypothetical protein